MYSVAKIFNGKVEYMLSEGMSCSSTLPILEYLKFMSEVKIYTYIHNMVVEGSNLTPFLLNNGFKHSNLKKLENFQFTKIENMEGHLFNINVRFNNKTVRFYDSKKILNFNIEDLKNDFLNTNETNEFKIVIESLNRMFDLGYTKTTMSSNAWEQFIKTNRFFKDNKGEYSNSIMRNIFPQLSLQYDEFIRKSYVGGWAFLNEKNKNHTKSGVALDVNSLYPFVMRTKSLPFGIPKEFKGEYIKDKQYPLFIQHVKFFNLKLKKNKFPFLRNNNLGIGEDYISNAKELDLYITSIDLEMIKRNYNFDKILFGTGLKFRSSSKLFNDYIDFYMNEKKTSKGTKRQIAKLFLNSLYGKFGSKVIREQNNYIINEQGREVRELQSWGATGTMYYTAMSSFICSYAREITIEAANSNYKNFIYSDTDSIHLKCSVKKVKDILIDSNELGAWKVEKEFTKCKFLGLKTYAEFENEWEFKIAGLPKITVKKLKIEDFYVGSEINCKIRAKDENGSIEVERTFVIGSCEIGKIKL